MSFKLSIVSPVGKILEDTVDSVALPGTEGAFEIYSKHMPFIASLKAGRVRVRHSGRAIFATSKSSEKSEDSLLEQRQRQETAYEITSGILEVDGEHNVILLADQATAV
jgi:F-type H+-transporting ATPase subunit epsilon